MWQWPLGVVSLVLGLAAALIMAQEDATIVRPPILPTAEHEVIILHTNDIHGQAYPWHGWDGDLLNHEVGGIATLAAAVRRVRAQLPADRVLLLDAGDATGPAYLGEKTDGRVITDSMEQLGYSAMALGNHDFAVPGLLERQRAMRMQLLAANVMRNDTGEPYARPFIIEKVGDIPLGIIGLANPGTPVTITRETVSALRFNPDSGAVVTDYLPRMYREGAQVIVVLSQLGLEADRRLARAVPAIDVIVGGHSHNRISEAQTVGKTIIVQAGAHGSDLGRLDLIFRNGGLERFRHQLIPLYTETYPADPQFAAIVNGYAAPLERQMNERLAQATAPIVRADVLAGEEPQKRSDASPADMLFADIVRERTQSDVAILPGQGYGTAILPGPVNMRQLRNVVSGAEQVVTMNLTGDQIRGILEQSIFNTYTNDPSQRVGGIVQVSGLTFAYDPTSTKGMAVKEMTVAGRPVDLNGTYRVATDSLLAVGGDRYASFKSGTNVQTHGPMADLIADGLRARGQVAPPTDTRMTLVKR